MAVYTHLSRVEAQTFIERFDIGSLTALEPISEGIENSNYRLETTSGRFILTLYEARVREADLPYFIGLMDHLAAAGFPCPVPVRDRTGQALHRLSGRPSAVVTFLDGTWPRTPDAAHCRALGKAAAHLHLAAQGFALRRANDLSVAAWRPLYAARAAQADELYPGFSAWIDRALSDVETRWPRGLPAGTIHADLFPDNVFFRDRTLTGVIDFYFACEDLYAYDLAVCMNAWCFDAGGRFARDRAAALFAGYGSVRPLATEEIAAMPVLACGAALRFLVTRLYDWFLPQDGAITRRKDPRQFVPVIEHHRAVADSSAYGIDCGE
jgi:homoserine kinase type II